MAKKQQKLTAEQLKALDWNNLLQKYGPIVLMFLKMLLGVVDGEPQLKAGARATGDERCPDEDLDCCCDEVLTSACETVAAALKMKQRCCPDEEQIYG